MLPGSFLLPPCRPAAAAAAGLVVALPAASSSSLLMIMEPSGAMPEGVPASVRQKQIMKDRQISIGLLNQLFNCKYSEFQNRFYEHPNTGS
jgi:hypothetical protein